jgi:hypothetical protein
VVAERDHVGAGLEHLVGELRGDPDAVGEILPVQDARVDAQLVFERRQALLDRTAARDADDVCNEKKSQGESVAAVRSSIVT